MEHIKGTVEHITYYNEENGYSVIKCKVKGKNGEVTVVGDMAEVFPGTVLNMAGEWKVNPKYGLQFVLERYEEELPADINGIESYLGGGLIKGIGPVYAKKIVKAFGTDTFDVIENFPNRLMEIDGVGEFRMQMIVDGYESTREIKNIMMFLRENGVNQANATRIYKEYGNESISTVKENPYRLADDIWGIGFKTADLIAENLGIPHDKFERVRAGIIHRLNSATDDGNCYLEKDRLMADSANLLNVSGELVASTLDAMIEQEDVIMQDTDSEETAIYLKPLYYAEIGVANSLKRILGGKTKLKVGTLGITEQIEERASITYDETQKNAIIQAVQNKVFVLTGGPGTGKTTTTKGIVEAFRTENARILLAAPTGRAAKRMSEAIGHPAKTIHRLLEYKPPNDYVYNEENPLHGDVLIVDECSMVDVVLMNRLLKAVPENMNLVLIGDTDQLPSVGAGNVLRDIIDSECFSTIRLTKIFRQAQQSRIITNAHRINKGEMPICNEEDTDFFFIEENEKENVGEVVRNLVCERLPSYCKVSPKDIQVLSPMQNGPAGTRILNQILQESINPVGVSLKYGVVYREGDKVMQIRNNYDKDVFNGDVGEIVDVDVDSAKLTVLFDDRRVDYEKSELDELKLSYASTIHKAQGSEYPVVVMPITMSHYVMLQRNLFYTGISRAKKMLVLVGQKQAIHMAVSKNTVSKRNSMLKAFLQEVKSHDER